MAAQTGYNLASRREVPHAKRGGRLVFSEVELRAWLVENRRTKADGSTASSFNYVIAPTTRKKGGKR